MYNKIKTIYRSKSNKLIKQLFSCCCDSHVIEFANKDYLCLNCKEHCGVKKINIKI